MRFMMFMLPNLPTEAGNEEWLPPREAVEAMTAYNDEMTKAGVLLALDGLHPGSAGVRVSFAEDGTTTVTDGPYTEAKEVIGGYWIIEVSSKDEAVEWARRCPGRGCAIDVRQVFEMDDFPPELRAAANL